MIWEILRYWVSFIIPVFYNRIQAKNIKNIQIDGPVIIAMNHPNAFTDPIIIAYLSYPYKVKYLARGDAFKPGFVTWFLSTLGIVPIFRIQDGGKEGLKKNEEAYIKVNQLLKKDGKVIVYAEGLCIQERRLRPLKKGVSRMVYGSYEYLGENNNLVVVPVGINYSKPDKFRSSVFLNVGEPIKVKEFIEEYTQNPARANNNFLLTLAPKMKELITHINNKENDEAVIQIEELCKKDWLKNQGLDFKDLEHDFNTLKEITEKVNTAEIEKPQSLQEFKTKAKTYFNKIKTNGLRDWLLNPINKNKITYSHLAYRICILILGFPVYLFALIGNYIPYKLTEKLSRKIAKNKEFYSSIVITSGMVFFLLNYLLWFIMVYLFSPTIFIPIFVCSGLILSGIFGLIYNPFKNKTKGVYRALKNKTLYIELFENRKELINLINKF